MRGQQAHAGPYFLGPAFWDAVFIAFIEGRHDLFFKKAIKHLGLFLIALGDSYGLFTASPAGWVAVGPPKSVWKGRQDAHLVCRHLPGDRRSRINHPHLRTGDLPDQGNNEGIMRAAQHNGIDPLRQHGLERLIQDGARCLGIQLA